MKNKIYLMYVRVPSVRSTPRQAASPSPVWPRELQTAAALLLVPSAKGTRKWFFASSAGLTWTILLHYIPEAPDMYPST